MIQYRCGKRIDVSKCPRWVRLGGNPSSHPISMGPWDLYRIGVPSFPGTSVGKPKSPGFPSNHLILSVVGGGKKGPRPYYFVHSYPGSSLIERHRGPLKCLGISEISTFGHIAR